MFYIVEQVDQISTLIENIQEKECFIQVITNNDNYHPKLSSISLIYFKPKNDKSYILCLDHSESFSIPIQEINKLLSKFEKVYCLDKKFHLYFFPNLPLIDVNFVSLEKREKYFDDLPTTLVHKYFYQKYSDKHNINKIIPISKHFERYELVYEKIKNDLWIDPISFYNNEYTNSFWGIEKNGIKIDENKFHKKYELHNDSFSLKDSKIYTNFHLYNKTTRPTNSFNGINFAALVHDNRDVFICENDQLVEIDFDCYHPRLIAKIIGYRLNDDPGHKQLASMYFNVPSPTPEQIDIAKKITFKQLYGGVEDQYKHIEYFNKVSEWLTNEGHIYGTLEYVELFGGRKIKIDKLNDAKLGSYIVQSAETYYNTLLLPNIFKILEGKKTKLIHYTYDSFLFDICNEENLLEEIKNIFIDNFPVKIKHGKDYKNMEKLVF